MVNLKIGLIPVHWRRWLAKLEVDDRDFNKMLKQLQRASIKSWKVAGRTFRVATPKDTGNAKNRTKYNSRRIEANYDYAGVLDDGMFSTKSSGNPNSKVTSKGFSKKAPKGMTEPALDKFEADLNKRVRKL